jgi:lipopolysaccharide export system permease protein
MANVDLRSVRLESKDQLPEGFRIHTDVNRWNPIKHIPKLQRYIFMEIIGPFTVALAFFTLIYIAMAVQKIIALIIGKGVDIVRLLDYLGYVLVNTIPNTIPMACLMGGIMAAGRLSGDSEITAMRSAGIGFTKIYTTFLLFGLATALSVGYLNFFIAPENTRKMNEFNNWIVAYNPMLAVTPGLFSGDKTQEAFQKKGRTMYTEGVNKENNILQGIQIREWEVFLEGDEYIRHNNAIIPMGGSRLIQVISAKKGKVVEKLNAKGEYEKSIRLQEGFVIEWNELKDGFSVTNFINGEMDYNIPAAKADKVIGFNIKPETFSFPMLLYIRKSIESDGLEKIPGLEILNEMGLQIKGIVGLKQMVQQMKFDIMKGAADGSLPPSELSNRYSIFSQLEKLLKDSQKTVTAFNVEIHKRIAMPVSCLIFFFLSFPLGLVVKRSGKGMSFTWAIVFLLIYYTFFILGSNISYKSGIPDWIGPWSANIIIACISVYITLSRTDINIKDNIIFKILAFPFLKIKKVFAIVYGIFRKLVISRRLF